MVVLREIDDPTPLDPLSTTVVSTLELPGRTVTTLVTPLCTDDLGLEEGRGDRSEGNVFGSTFGSLSPGTFRVGRTPVCRDTVFRLDPLPFFT